MSIISRMRRQKAVYWAKLGTDRYGQPTYSAAVEIDCRWVDLAEEFMDKAGRIAISNSKVYADRVLTLGGMLWHGLLVGADPVPTNNVAAYEIRKFDRVPNIKATEILYRAML